MFDFAGWLKEALVVAGALLPLNMSITKASEKLGLAGTWQAVFALGSGLVLGVATSLAVWGFPADYQGWFLAVVFGLIVGGASIGTYEVVKHAASKARE
jgi:uncharacterized membrane protein YedE/YeeE